MSHVPSFVQHLPLMPPFFFISCKRGHLKCHQYAPRALDKKYSNVTSIEFFAEKQDTPLHTFMLQSFTSIILDGFNVDQPLDAPSILLMDCTVDLREMQHAKELRLFNCKILGLPSCDFLDIDSCTFKSLPPCTTFHYCGTHFDCHLLPKGARNITIRAQRVYFAELLPRRDPKVARLTAGRHLRKRPQMTLPQSDEVTTWLLVNQRLGLTSRDTARVVAHFLALPRLKRQRLN